MDKPKRIDAGHLCMDERIAITDMHRAGSGVRAIARTLGRAPSTISRELRRNADDIGGAYGPHRARQTATHRPRRSHAKSCRAATPAQTCHATGAHRPQAPWRRPIQTPQVPRAHGHGRRPAGRGRRPSGPRPLGGLICGAGNRSATGTLAERTTRSTILPHLPDGHDTEHVQDAITGKTRPPPALPRNSPAWDRGPEPAPHTRVSAAPGMQVYFRNPHSPRQRGTNKNTNGSPRQYSPKGTDPSGYTEEHLDAAAVEPNDRPRKTPDHTKPSEKTSEPIDDTATSTPTDTNNTDCQQRCCNDH